MAKKERRLRRSTFDWKKDPSVGVKDSGDNYDIRDDGFISDKADYILQDIQGSISGSLDEFNHNFQGESLFRPQSMNTGERSDQIDESDRTSKQLFSKHNISDDGECNYSYEWSNIVPVDDTQQDSKKELQVQEMRMEENNESYRPSCVNVDNVRQNFPRGKSKRREEMKKERRRQIDSSNKKNCPLLTKKDNESNSTDEEFISDNAYDEKRDKSQRRPERREERRRKIDVTGRKVSPSCTENDNESNKTNEETIHVNVNDFQQRKSQDRKERREERRRKGDELGQKSSPSCTEKEIRYSIECSNADEVSSSPNAEDSNQDLQQIKHLRRDMRREERRQQVNVDDESSSSSVNENNQDLREIKYLRRNMRREEKRRQSDASDTKFRQLLNEKDFDIGEECNNLHDKSVSDTVDVIQQKFRREKLQRREIRKKEWRRRSDGSTSIGADSVQQNVIGTMSQHRGDKVEEKGLQINGQGRISPSFIEKGIDDGSEYSNPSKKRGEKEQQMGTYNRKVRTILTKKSMNWGGECNNVDEESTRVSVSDVQQNLQVEQVQHHEEKIWQSDPSDLNCNLNSDRCVEKKEFDNFGDCTNPCDSNMCAVVDDSKVRERLKNRWEGQIERQRSNDDCHQNPTGLFRENSFCDGETYTSIVDASSFDSIENSLKDFQRKNLKYRNNKREESEWRMNELERTLFPSFEKQAANGGDDVGNNDSRQELTDNIDLRSMTVPEATEGHPRFLLESNNDILKLMEMNERLIRESKELV